MTTPIEQLIDTVQKTPSESFSGNEYKEIVLTLLRLSLDSERMHFVDSFIEGQSKPKASFQAWADKRFSKAKKQTEENE
jgi:hypothetical protein